MPRSRSAAHLPPRSCDLIDIGQGTLRARATSGLGEDVMFKRVLLCYDGSVAGRRALRRGADLAIFLGAQVYVLSIIPAGTLDPVLAAGAAGHACIVDEDHGYRQMLDESVEWLKARGVA